MEKVKCILLVDDNSGDNYYNEYIIAETGACNHIKIALNGIQALDYLKKSREANDPEDSPIPDLIFLDINMPKMNGFEFLKEYEMQDDNMKSGVKIIMLTSSPNPDDRKKALAFKDISDYYVKPLSIEVLEDIINKYF
jgi:CheY-like chemotaxis protein